MTTTISLGTKKGAGCLILFALPFAGVGVVMLCLMVWDVIAYYQAQSWEEVPAQIVQAKLKSHSDSDGTSYKATAKYTYQYKDRQYSSDRVSFSLGSDNVGSFQKDAHRTLKKHQQSGKPFRCYVDPDNPSEAVLFRDIRWGMIGIKLMFALVFGGAGFGMLGFFWYALRKTKQKEKLAALHPDEPWLCKKSWAEGKIRSSTNLSVILTAVFAFFWNVISWPLVIAALNDPSFREQKFAWFFLLFPLVGLIMIFATIVAFFRWRKYGRTMFEMASVPGVIGGQLTGVIRIPRKVRTEDAFHLRLCCVRRTVSSGKNSTVSENTLWEDEQRIERDLLRRNPEKTAIPVLFQIPYECNPTDESDANRQVLWRLEVKAKTPGLDLSTSFEVPVFKTDESDPDFVVDRSLIAEYSAKEDPDRDLHEAKLRKTKSPTRDGGIRLIFPMARTPGMACMLMLMGCVFGSVPVIMYYLEAPLIANIIFGAVFGLVGLVLFFGSLETWFYRSTVDISTSILTVTGGFFGWGQPRRIDVSEIEKIVPKSRMSSGAGTSKKVYYDIDIVLTSGKKVTAGKRILGKRLVESVIRQIEQDLLRE